MSTIENDVITQNKEFLRQEKIAKVIGEEFKKKLAKYSKEVENPLVFYRLCNHFLQSIIEYDKPYSYILSEVKRGMNIYVNKLKQENLSAIDNYQKIIEFQRKENENLKHELEISQKLCKDKKENEHDEERAKITKEVKINHSLIISENNNSENLSKFQDKDIENKRNNSKQIISKNGIIIPKLDLSIITESRKTEAIVIAKPIKECSKSISDFSQINSKYMKQKIDSKLDKIISNNLNKM